MATFAWAQAVGVARTNSGIISSAAQEALAVAMAVQPLETRAAICQRASSTLRCSARRDRRVAPTTKAESSGATQVLRAAEMFALLRVALVVRIPSGMTSPVEQAALAAATVVLGQTTSAAAWVVWSSRWQQASCALQTQLRLQAPLRAQLRLRSRRPPLRAQLRLRRKVCLKAPLLAFSV